jgi:NAD(P)-dependent dehydrogenase (short-subunit alcohol dehydrogenase family)
MWFKKNKEVVSMGMLEGKVVVVTGAGRGIGREIALLMAGEGAKVVVNDLGGTESGAGDDRKVADEVVEDIKKAGGEAAANYDSVTSWEGGQRIIQTAIDSFGKLDVLVNNAGILRDRIIFKMSDEEWDGVIKTHLYGTFYCTRAASVHFREQKSGRLIHFTSTAGLIGNVGQANYAAAKLGIAAFSKICALDLQRSNVTSNAISPFAWTRLIATIPTDTPEQKAKVDKLSKMSPADVAPLVCFLASDSAQNITGQIFGVRGKEVFLFSQPRIVRSIHDSEGWTPEKLEKMLEPTMKSHFMPLDYSGSYIGWDPLT